MMSRHKAVDALRSEAVRHVRELRTAASSEPTTAGADEEVLHHDLAARLAASLDQLHPNQKQAIELAFYGGFSYREVAVILGRAEGTVKGRIRTGLAKLRTLLDDLVGPETTGRAVSNAASPAESLVDPVALTTALMQIETEAELHERELRQSFDARVTLEQAKGSISERDDLSLREAFARLHALARRDQRGLLETATSVVDNRAADANGDELKIDLTDAADATAPTSR